MLFKEYYNNETSGTSTPEIKKEKIISALSDKIFDIVNKLNQVKHNLPNKKDPNSEAINVIINDIKNLNKEIVNNFNK